MGIKSMVKYLNDDLQHFGVKGMRWGVRRANERALGDALIKGASKREGFIESYRDPISNKTYILSQKGSKAEQYVFSEKGFAKTRDKINAMQKESWNMNRKTQQSRVRNGLDFVSDHASTLFGAALGAGFAWNLGPKGRLVGAFVGGSAGAGLDRLDRLQSGRRSDRRISIEIQRGK